MKVLRAIAALAVGGVVLVFLVSLLADRRVTLTIGADPPPAAGAVEMGVVFRPMPDAPREPIVVTGESAVAGETLTAVYQSENAIVFEFKSKSGEPLRSRPFPFTPGREYRLRFEASSLYPAAGDPFFSGRTPVEIASFKRWVRLAIDAAVLLDAPDDDVTVPTSTVAFGIDRRSGEDGRFTGFIRRPARAPLPPPVSSGPGHGDVLLVVNPAVGAPAGSVQPLLAVGAGSSAGVLGLKSLGNSRHALRFARPGAEPIESGPLDADGAAVRLSIRFGPMLDLAASSPLSILRETIAVWVNGRPSWWTKSPAPVPAAPASGILLHDPAAAAGTEGDFTGRLAEWKALPPPGPWSPGPFSRVTLLIGGRGTATDPLVATGVAGKADTLAIEWLPGGKARLICDHWSVGASTSGEFEWRDNAVRSVAIEFPSFANLDQGVGTVDRGPLRVVVDGTEIWSTTVEYYRASSASLVLGRNPAGSSIAASTISAAVLDITR